MAYNLTREELIGFIMEFNKKHDLIAKKFKPLIDTTGLLAQRRQNLSSSMAFSSNLSLDSMVEIKSSITIGGETLLAYIISMYENFKPELSANCASQIQISRLFIYTVRNLCKAYAKLIEAENFDPSTCLVYMIYSGRKRIERMIKKDNSKLRKEKGVRFLGE